jgi:hypothetical protein
MTRGVIKLYQAVPVMGSNPAKAAEMLRDAAGIYDRLLAVYPRAFNFRIYKLQILTHETTVLGVLRRTDDLRKRQAELFALEETILRDTPKATFVRYMTRGVRSEALVYAARSGDVGHLDAAAADLLTMVRESRVPQAGGAIRYNVACAYAQASRFARTADEQELWAARAVQELEVLTTAGYFAVPAFANQMKRDPDLEPVRGRDDFKAFQAKLAAGKK